MWQQIFELIYGPPMFKDESYSFFDLEILENVLYQMMTYLEEDFKLERLDINDAYRRYFDEAGACMLCTASVLK